jgi:hypothetical protein
LDEVGGINLRQNLGGQTKSASVQGAAGSRVTASDRPPSKVSWIQFQFQRSVYVIDPLSTAVAKISGQVKSSTFLNANFEIFNISQLHYRV